MEPKTTFEKLRDFSPNPKSAIKFRDGEKQQEYEVLLEKRREQIEEKISCMITTNAKELISKCNEKIAVINKLLKDYK